LAVDKAIATLIRLTCVAQPALCRLARQETTVPFEILQTIQSYNIENDKLHAMLTTSNCLHSPVTLHQLWSHIQQHLS